MTLWDVRLILITLKYNFQIKYCNSTQLLKILNDSLLVCSSCNQIWLRRGDLREVKQSHYLQLQTHQDYQLSSLSHSFQHPEIMCGRWRLLETVEQTRRAVSTWEWLKNICLFTFVRIRTHSLHYVYFNFQF